MDRVNQTLPTERVRLDYIDALRGIAALMVLVCHSLQVDDSLVLPGSLADYFKAGKYGVQLFFIISGFTLFYSLHNSDADTGNFFIRRFFRIAPLYFLATVFYGWLYDVPFEGVGLNLAFLHGFSPTYINSVVPGGWSIGVEMVFYCMVPFLFTKITNIGKALNFFVLAVVLGFACLYAYKKLSPSIPIWESFVYFWLPNQLMIFALGFVLYFLSFSKKSITAKEVFVPLMTFCLLVIFTLITKLAMFGEHLVFAVACTGIIYLLGKKGMPGVVNKTTLFLGKVSYSLYLSQYAAIKILQKTNFFSFLHSKVGLSAIGNLVVNLCLLFITTALISFLLYHFVEMPCQKFGKKFLRKITYITSSSSPSAAMQVTTIVIGDNIKSEPKF